MYEIEDHTSHGAFKVLISNATTALGPMWVETNGSLQMSATTKP